MTAKVRSIVKTVQQMSPMEKLELLSAISETLPPRDALTATQFRQPRTVDELIREQRISPIRGVADLAADFWPEDESADDIVKYVYGQRREGRTGA